MNDSDLEGEGRAAHLAGVPWWNNPYPAGSKRAGRWDSGHTASRKLCHQWPRCTAGGNHTDSGR